MRVNFKFLKFIIDQFFNFLLHLAKLQHHQSNRNAFKLVFLAKACFEEVDRSMKIGEAIVFLADPYH